MANTTEGLSFEGPVKIFAMNGIQAKFFVAKAPFPSHIPKHVVPVYQIATLEKPLCASQLFSDFVGTGFDVVKLHNVLVSYQNCLYDRKQTIGWHVQADLIFDETYGVAHDILEGICGVRNPRLRVSCDLETASWNNPLSVSSFVLEGYFQDINVSPCPALTFTSLGLRIIGFDGLTWSDDGVKPSKTYGFDLFGNLRLNFGSPLSLGFHILKVGDILQLTAVFEQKWKHAFGIENLTLEAIRFSSVLTLGHKWSSFSLEVEAALSVMDASLVLEGSLAGDGNFDIFATASDWTWGHISAFYKDIFGQELTSSELDISIGSITLRLSSRSGLCFDLHRLQVGEYVAVSATLRLSRDGAFLRGELNGGGLVLDKELPIVISDAYVQLDFARRTHDEQRQASLMVGGNFTFMEYTVQVNAHIYKCENEVHYTIYGAFEDSSPSSGFQISQHLPGLENTPLKNICLSKVAVIVCSRDDAELSVFGKSSHSMIPVCKGIQICAILSNCGPVHSLSKAQTEPLLFMSLAWRDGELGVSIIPAIPLTIELGGGVVTETLSLHVTVGTSPALKARTGLKIPVAGRQEPLRFMAEIELSEIEATLTGQLVARGGWNNPFGLSKRLTIGPNLILSASILYAGAPGALAFVGGLKIGDVTGQVAFKVDADPKKQLFTVKCESASLLDIVSLICDVIEVEIPYPPNLIQFDDFEMYVCPFDVTIGTIRYSQGFSFTCRGVIFSHRGHIIARITKTGAKFSGAVDRFELGPLSMKGMKGSNPLFDLEISVFRQAGTMDGQIKLFNNFVNVFCKFELTPQFILEFYFDLEFAGLFVFRVRARPLPKTSLEAGDLPSDFLLASEFHQQGCGKISHRLNELLRKLHKDEREATEAAERSLTEDRERWEKVLRLAQHAADIAFNRYIEKLAAAEAAYDEEKRQIDDDLARLRKKLNDARSAFERDLSNAKGDLRAAKNERDRKIAKAEEELRQTKKEWSQKLEYAQNDLRSAQRDLASAFSYAQRDLDRAKADVNSIQGDINGCHRRIQECNDASWFGFEKAEIPYLMAKIVALEAARAIAQTALDAAKLAVAGGEVASRQGALEIAKGAVEAAKFSGAVAIDVATVSLSTTRDAMNLAVEGALGVVTGVRVVGGEAVKVAADAFETASSAASDALRASRTALDVIKSGPEWLEYKAKLLALEAAKASGSAALEIAKTGVGVGKDVAEVAFNIAHWSVEMIGSLIVVTDVHLSLNLSQAVEGLAFEACIQGTFHDEPFKYHIDLNPKMAEDWILKVFDRLIGELKLGIIKI